MHSSKASKDNKSSLRLSSSKKKPTSLLTLSGEIAILEHGHSSLCGFSRFLLSLRTAGAFFILFGAKNGQTAFLSQKQPCRKKIYGKTP
jgi:hypothetical protein